MFFGNRPRQTLHGKLSGRSFRSYGNARRSGRRLATEPLERREMLSADPSWLTTFGGVSVDVVHDVAVGPDDDVYVTGEFRDTVDFDPGPGLANRTATGGIDVFVARYSGADGSLVWARSFGRAAGTEIAVDVSGSAIVAGTFQGSVDVDGDGSVDLTSQGGDDLFVAKFDGAGMLQWTRQAGGTGTETSTGLALDGAGNAYLAATTSSAVLDAGTIQVSGASGLIATVDASGNFAAVHPFGGSITTRDLAADAGGNVYATGYFNGTATFGVDAGGNAVTRTAPAGQGHGFAVKIAANDRVEWVDVISSSYAARATAAAVSATGEVYVIGTFTGIADLDPGVGVTTAQSQGHQDLAPAQSADQDVYVQRLGADGSLIAARALGGIWADGIWGLALATDGTAVVSGNFARSIDLAGISLAGAGSDAFVAALDENLNAVWAERLGSAIDHNPNRAYGLAIDSGGSVVVGGSFFLDAEFPTGETVNVQGWSDGYVMKWNPQLPTINGRVFFDTNGDGVDNDLNRALSAGWTVYLDANGNGQRDASELLQTTRDASGNFNFGQLPPGTYTVAIELPPGWSQTAPMVGGSPGPYQVTLGVGDVSPQFSFGVSLPTATETLVSTDVPKKKITSSPVSSVTTVGGPARMIVDMDVEVHYTENSSSNLKTVIELISPSGTQALLVDRWINPGLNFDATISDEPAPGITSPEWWASNTDYAPLQQFLSDMDGEDVRGTWTLRTRRLLSSGQGATLQSWSMIVTYALLPTTPQPPVIVSLSDSPDPVVAGNPVTLTANGVADPDGTVASVSFYRDANGNGQLDVGVDTLVGTDASSSGGWTTTASTVGLSPGAYTYFAQAIDNDGLTSAVVSTTSDVIAAPSGNVNDMYVWDIWVYDSRDRGGKHEDRFAVTIRRDSDGDGFAESTDAAVASVSVTLHQQYLAGGSLWSATGTTDSSGRFLTGWIRTWNDGEYLIEVTALTHATYLWNRSLDPTGNDTDLDGDNLPDQLHAVPHSASASAIVVSASGASSPSASVAYSPRLAVPAVARRVLSTTDRSTDRTVASAGVDEVMRLYARRRTRAAQAMSW